MNSDTASKPIEKHPRCCPHTLRLAVLRDPSAIQADLCAPAAVFPLEDAAFVIASFTCHVHSSFL